MIRFDKLLPPLTNHQNQERSPIILGQRSSVDGDKLISLMNRWTQQIDKAVLMDVRLHGKPSKYSHALTAFRGFSYLEFLDLFNSHVTEEAFAFHPAYSQVKGRQGGIIKKKHLHSIQVKFEPSKESYRDCLEEYCHPKLMSDLLHPRLKEEISMTPDQFKLNGLLLGGSGSGKSTLVKGVIRQLATADKNSSIVLIDPHGDVARDLFWVKDLKERMIYIDPFLHPDFTPCINPLDVKGDTIQAKSNTAEQVIKVFEEVLSTSGELTEIMINCMEKVLYVLLSRDKVSTLSDVKALLDLEPSILAEAEQKDKFFNKEYSHHGNKTRLALLSRIDRLLNSPALRDLIGSASSFSLQKEMNSNAIIIFDISKLGEMSQIAFGKFILSTIKSLVRLRTKPSNNQSTFLFIEESHLLAGSRSSLEYMLSQLRGYGLHTMLISQYLSQMDNHIQTAINNTGLKIVSSSNNDDAKKLLGIESSTATAYEFIVSSRGRSATHFIANPPNQDNVFNENDKNALIQKQLGSYYRKRVPESLKTASAQPNNNSPKPKYTITIPDDKK